MPYTSLGAYTTKQADPFSFTGNQAALAQIKSLGAGIYGERRFLLAENTVYGVALALPTKMGNFGDLRFFPTCENGFYLQFFR